MYVLKIVFPIQDHTLYVVVSVLRDIALLLISSCFQNLKWIPFGYLFQKDWWFKKKTQNWLESQETWVQKFLIPDFDHLAFTVLFSSVQSLSRVRLFVIPWIAARQASLSITNSRSSPRLTSIESVMPSSHLILCRPLLLLPPIPPSIRVFSNESNLRMRWNFSFSIIPSKEIPGLISFRMDWLDLLGVQGTLKSLLQHHSSKASILRCSAFFTVELSHPYMTTGKTIALTRWTFVGKVCLCFSICYLGWS